jgi:hypothetical protein
MAIAGGALGCYVMYIRNGVLQQVKSTGNKDTVTTDATIAANRILAGGSANVLANAAVLAEVRRLVAEGKVSEWSGMMNALRRGVHPAV